ncbi:MAG: hypothetical protein JAY94_04335 [Candidatus Thiodiazotropha endolucinida]|nr:hypothetical protein [Candidatus Thiodiazotropha taylori]MCW4316719.1 hypothetical protein [Candidatus Thiodiazotropha taylori]
MKAEELWDNVRTESQNKGISMRYVDKIRRELGEVAYEGEVVAYVADGEAQQTAFRMLALRVEQAYLKERLQMIVEKEKLATREFWLSVHDEYGMDDSREVSFDPDTGAVYSHYEENNNSYSYHKTVNGYAKLLEEAMDNPLIAHRMAQDYMLPEWLKEIAGVLVSDGLKPAIRSALEDGLKDPGYAALLSRAGQTKAWPAWLVEALEVLSQRYEG